jgi:hypothetical protein
MEKKNFDNIKMSATDRYKAIEQFKNMMDKKLSNDYK